MVLPNGFRNDFFELEGKLEHELKKFDASVDTTPSIDAQRAYNIVFDTMQSNPQLVRDSGIGRVIDSILLKLKLSPEEYWSGTFRS